MGHFRAVSDTDRIDATRRCESRYVNILSTQTGYQIDLNTAEFLALVTILVKVRNRKQDMGLVFRELLQPESSSVVRCCQKETGTTHSPNKDSFRFQS